jgi:hypothetical protein
MNEMVVILAQGKNSLRGDDVNEAKCETRTVVEAN